jgi:MFS family permease
MSASSLRELSSYGVETRARGRGLSHKAGFWAVAVSMAVLTAFSTAPSPLYGLYQKQDGLSSITITIVYAVYAAGIVVSLLLVGHVSDWYGRRPVLIPALLVAFVGALVFSLSTSLSALFVGRVLTGLALGAAIATATAYLTDLDAGTTPGPPTLRSQIVGTTANIGGLAVGPLFAGLLGQYVAVETRLPYYVFAVLLLLAVVATVKTPEVRPLPRPRPRYHPQRLAAPSGGRAQFVAALTGAFLDFTVFGVFAGLSAAFLAGSLHRSSPALAGVAIFVAFGVGALTQVMTIKWTVHRLIRTAIPFVILGLAAVVLAAWLSPPSLALFLVGAALLGIGTGCLFRGTLTLVVSTASPDDRAGAIAAFFVAGYSGISLPVVGAGIALMYVSFNVTILAFSGVIIGGILLASPFLLKGLSAPD